MKDFQCVKNGYIFDSINEIYKCNICGEEYSDLEFFEHDGRYYRAKRRIEIHIETVHGGVFNQLISFSKKQSGLTDNQISIMKMIYDGHTDNEIAEKLGVTSSTIRHQRFNFCEKVDYSEEEITGRIRQEEKTVPIPHPVHHI